MIAPLNHQHRASRLSAFTLVELLVVISIVSVLLALLLPAFNRARDVAMETKCRGNMRQIFTSSEAFRADYNAILPAEWYPRYNQGFDGFNLPADRGNSQLYTHVLMDKDYLPNVRKPYGFLTDDSFATLATVARSSVFGCPSMFTRLRSNYYDSRFPPGAFTNPIANDIERRSAAFWIDLGYDAATPTQNRTGQVFSGYYVTSLTNVSATYVKNMPNRGYFSYKDWRSSPATVAFLFEDYFWTPGPTSYYINGITITSSNYQPAIRHNNYTSTNLVFADGHVVKFPTPKFTSLAEVSNPANEVWMNFY